MTCRFGLSVLVGAASLSLAAPMVHAQATIDFPLGVGLHVPSYDRVNGLSLPFGPTVTIGEDRLVLEPAVTYRSHLGKFDPSLALRWRIVDSALALSVTGGRGTFTNDRWIRSDLMNSLTSLGIGTDSRNYFRADRAEGRLTLTRPLAIGPAEVYAGAHVENAWSTGWRAGEKRGPYSFLNRNDTLNGIDRPNPLINTGHIASAVFGIGGAFMHDRFSSDIRLRMEASWHTPLGTNFQQFTLYEEGEIRTIGEQRLEVAVHAITTTGNPAPRQRYAYIGGSGTLATIDLMTLGGDHMYFADMLYVIPISQLTVPAVGSFFIAPHYAIGAASIGQFGIPTANVGVRAGLGPIRVDYLVNPRTHKHDFGYGLSFSR